MRRTAISFLPTLLFAAMGAVCVLPSPGFAADADCDGIEDGADNCPARFNPTQGDLDGDLAGDRCDSDKDGDGVANDADICPKDSDASQADTDADGVGDACDACAEPPGDVVAKNGCTIDQLCPCDGPDGDQAWNGHGKYVRCVKKKARHFAIKELITTDDRRAIVIAARESSCGAAVVTAGDNDGDGVADGDDNCPSDVNPSQRNTDGDAFGDACDGDKDDDGVPNGADNCPIVENPDGQGADADADSVGDACDVCTSTASGPVDRTGCSIDDACPCDTDSDGLPWASHTKYRRCVDDEAFRFRLLRIIDKEDAEAVRAAAAESDCGDRPPICE
jgi:hypothetical protein